MNVYCYPADMYGCGAYRIIWVSQVLRAQGHNVNIILPNDRSRSLGGDLDSNDDNRLVAINQVPPDADVIVLQRIVMRQLAQAVPLLRRRGVAVVIDMDDDLTTIHPANIAFTNLHPKAGRHRYYSWTNAEHACRDATLVTVSTDALLPVYAPHGRGVVLHNRIPARYLDIPRVDSDVIGWGGSVHSHPDDLQTVGTALTRLQREGLTIASIGDPADVRANLQLDRDQYAYGPLPIQQWPYALASLGVGIAPLADTRFNHAKSWLKPLEMAACGVPWVASPRTEYRRLHEAGSGLLAERPKDWYRQIKRVATDHGLRSELSQAGRTVASVHTIEGNAWRWLEVWADALLAQRRQAASPFIRV